MLFCNRKEVKLTMLFNDSSQKTHFMSNKRVWGSDKFYVCIVFLIICDAALTFEIYISEVIPICLFVSEGKWHSEVVEGGEEDLDVVILRKNPLSHFLWVYVSTVLVFGTKLLRQLILYLEFPLFWINFSFSVLLVCLLL